MNVTKCDQGLECKAVFVETEDNYETVVVFRGV